MKKVKFSLSMDVEVQRWLDPLGWESATNQEVLDFFKDNLRFAGEGDGVTQAGIVDQKPEQDKVIILLLGRFVTEPVEDSVPNEEAIAAFRQSLSFEGEALSVRITDVEEVRVPELRPVWVRLGGFLNTTEAEADALLGGKLAHEDLVSLVKKLIDEGRFKPKGDSYVPDIVVSDFNVGYGTDYPEEDVNFCLN